MIIVLVDNAPYKMHELLSTVPITWSVCGPAMAHQYLDGITDVVIHWDDADGEYCAGQTLTGKIEVTVREVTRFKGVVLKVGDVICQLRH